MTTDTHRQRALALAALCFGLLALSCSTKSVGDGFPASPDDTTSQNALIEHLPIDLSRLDFVAIVGKREGRDADWLPLHDYGLVFPATTDRPTSKTNPQPTFYAPLGTPVFAVVSGTITSTPRLYSGDSSIMIAAHGGNNAPIWEMEHVIKLRVAVGDVVAAGDTIAEVSNYECVWGRNSNPADPLCASGLGLVEIGLLYGGSPPSHRCPFEAQLVAPSKRASIFAQLDSARARIDAAYGDSTRYDKSGWATPQCVSLTYVPG